MRPFRPHVGPFRPQNTKSKFWANFLEPAVGLGGPQGLVGGLFTF